MKAIIRARVDSSSTAQDNGRGAASSHAGPSAPTNIAHLRFTNNYSFATNEPTRLAKYLLNNKKMHTDEVLYFTNAVIGVIRDGTRVLLSGGLGALRAGSGVEVEAIYAKLFVYGKHVNVERRMTQEEELPVVAEGGPAGLKFRSRLDGFKEDDFTPPNALFTAVRRELNAETCEVTDALLATNTAVAVKSADNQRHGDGVGLILTPSLVSEISAAASECNNFRLSCGSWTTTRCPTSRPMRSTSWRVKSTPAWRLSTHYSFVESTRSW